MASVTEVDADDAKSFLSGTTLVNPQPAPVPVAAPTPKGPRTLHIYRDTLIPPDTVYRIRDSDDQTEIYVAEVSALARPQIQIYSVAEYQQKGRQAAPITARLHHLNTDVDIAVREQRFYFVLNGWIHKRYEWPSPAFGMNMLKWQREFSFDTKECYANDDRKNVLARYVSAGWSPSKVGELQILARNVSTAAGSPALEELIVTLLADREIDSRLTSA